MDDSQFGQQSRGTPYRSPTKTARREGRLFVLSQTLLQIVCLRRGSQGMAKTGLFAWAAWATILALPVSVAALLLQPGHHDANVILRPDPPATGRLRLTDPANGTRVDEVIDVRGVTPFPDKKHYLLVTAPTGGTFIQDAPMEVSQTGILTGRATLGNKAVGAGLSYTIRVLATRTTLLRLSASPPDDAIFSDPITVTRKPKGV